MSGGVEESKNEEFKKLVGEAKCNVCHIDKENKKKRNPFGEALEKGGMDKEKFKPLLKSDEAKAKQELGSDDIMKHFTLPESSRM